MKTVVISVSSLFFLFFISFSPSFIPTPTAFPLYMPHIPTEILIAIGNSLDRRSLVTCLQVSRVWHDTLLPLNWSSITVLHWLRPTFFLTTWKPLYDVVGPPSTTFTHYNARVHNYLQHIRSLAWRNNSSMPMYCHGHKQIQIKQLVLVLQRTSNLTHFSLVMVLQGIDDYILSSILYLLQDLEHLSELEIDVPRQGLAIPIKKHLPLFAQLEELKIRGNWYSGVETLGPVSFESIPWKLRRLAIDRIDMSFFRFCAQLEHLTFRDHLYKHQGSSQNPEIKSVIVEQLQGLPRLNTVVVDLYFGAAGYAGKTIVRVEGSETQWTLSCTDSEKPVNQSIFTLRNVFALSQP